MHQICHQNAKLHILELKRARQDATAEQVIEMLNLDLGLFKEFPPPQHYVGEKNSCYSAMFLQLAL